MKFSIKPTQAFLIVACVSASATLGQVVPEFLETRKALNDYHAQERQKLADERETGVVLSYDPRYTTLAR